MPSPSDHSLSEELLATTRRAIVGADRQRAVLHLLDWMACARGACGEPARQAMAGVYRQQSTNGLALLGHVQPAEAELMMDAMLGSLLEMDDVHRAAVLHPGPVVVPAALLAARQVGADSSALLDAIVVGYEVMIRIGRGMGRQHYTFWHPTATLGPFGAAAAVARLLGLDEQQTSWALGNAGTRTGGLWQLRHEPVPSKSLHTALAARDGWLAAMLAGKGFSGPRYLLEGPQGLLNATARDADPEQMLAVASGWLIHEVSFKPWPACRHAHPAIDALLALGELPRPEAIDRIEVETYQAALDFCDRTHPQTPAEARFSIQHALAAAVIRGRPSLAQYQSACIADPGIAALRSRIALRVDAEFDQAFPAHYGAGVVLRTRDGTVRQARINDAWGDPENPLQSSDLVAKSVDLLTQAGIEPNDVQTMIRQTLALGDGASLADWRSEMAGIAG